MGASWFGSDWAYRVPVTIDNTGGSPGAEDVTITWPGADFTKFWGKVDTDGDDIRVTDADGITELDFELRNYNSSTNTLLLLIDAYTYPAEGLCIVYVYWGTTGKANGSAAFTLTGTEKTGYVTLQHPRPERTIAARREAAGAEKPAQQVYKSPGETAWHWWDVTSVFVDRCDAFNLRRGLEGPDAIRFAVETAGSDESGLYDEDATRLIECADGIFIRTQTKAGTDGNDHTMVLTVQTIDKQGDGQTLEFRALIRITSPEE